VVTRSVDRVHSLELLRAGAEEPVRETWESAAIMGAMALEKLGVEAEEIARIGAMVRERDAKRLQLQLTSGLRAGRSLYFTGKPH
jgi:glutathione-regulated potassium-efflux system protein KefB